MKNLNRIGGLGTLALGLGVGAAMAAVPGVASAGSLGIDGGAGAAAVVDVADISTTVGAAAAVTPPTLPDDFANYAVSVFGVTLYQTGTATASSTFGNIAIANGDMAAASAVGNGLFNYAYADGDDSIASTNLGGGFFNSATAMGEHSIAGAGGVLGSGSFNVASATGFAAVADAGYTSGQFLGGSFNTATSEGSLAVAIAGADGSSNNVASAIGDGSFDSAPDVPSGAATDLFGDSATSGSDFWGDLWNLLS